MFPKDSAETLCRISVADYKCSQRKTNTMVFTVV
ncbi:hypothetical protein SHM7688_00381 [Shimia marina]|uniref:Uncharacterized protein n=1 Tax=Shimia marina TaxID=321267 RepID=A0A0P1EKH9_9RHOB|nr:hypothetical protein SHM7688_00381 [Shimia marina]